MSRPTFSVADAELAHMVQAAVVVDVFSDEQTSSDRRALELGNYVLTCGLLEDRYDNSATVTSLVIQPNYLIITTLRSRATGQVASPTLFEWGLVQAGSTVEDATALADIAFKPNIERYFWALEHVEPEHKVPGAAFVRRGGEVRDKSLDQQVFVEALVAQAVPIIPRAA